MLLIDVLDSMLGAEWPGLVCYSLLDVELDVPWLLFVFHCLLVCTIYAYSAVCTT